MHVVNHTQVPYMVWYNKHTNHHYLAVCTHSVLILTETSLMGLAGYLQVHLARSTDGRGSLRPFLLAALAHD